MAAKFTRKRQDQDLDDFDAVRLDVEDELLDDPDDDPEWRPLDLNELPDDFDDDQKDG